MHQLWVDALAVLTLLQKESARLQNVTNEYYFRNFARLFFQNRDQNRRRSRRYGDAIEDIKRVIWPLVSFRFLVPLAQLSSSREHARMSTLHERIRPTKSALDSFEESLRVMRRLARMLKNYQMNPSEFSNWDDLERAVTKGYFSIQRELAQAVQLINSPTADGLKLISYYAFLVRCNMIWEGLKSAVDKLGPLQPRPRALSLPTPVPSGTSSEVLPTRSLSS